MYKNSKNTRIWARDTPLVHELKGLSKRALRLQAQAEAAVLAKRDVEILAKAELLRKKDEAKEAAAYEAYKRKRLEQKGGRLKADAQAEANSKSKADAEAKARAREKYESWIKVLPRSAETKYAKPREPSIQEQEAGRKYWQDDKDRKSGYAVEGDNAICCPKCRHFQYLKTKPNGDAVCSKCTHEWWPHRAPRLQK